MARLAGVSVGATWPDLLGLTRAAAATTRRCAGPRPSGRCRAGPVAGAPGAAPRWQRCCSLRLRLGCWGRRTGYCRTSSSRRPRRPGGRRPRPRPRRQGRQRRQRCRCCRHLVPMPPPMRSRRGPRAGRRRRCWPPKGGSRACATSRRQRPAPAPLAPVPAAGHRGRRSAGPRRARPTQRRPADALRRRAPPRRSSSERRARA
mmetsp:Transcript_173760/g.556908  ORF Transcript_173760/g.556908 Transcript_173760/m.556908 type:complete len:203 (+) Transcript_173760:15-623(+)